MLCIVSNAQITGWADFCWVSTFHVITPLLHLASRYRSHSGFAPAILECKWERECSYFCHFPGSAPSLSFWPLHHDLCVSDPFATCSVLTEKHSDRTLSSFPPSHPASQAASTLEEMGRKEEEDCGSWKKQTTNIRKTFIFMEVLGS